MIEYIRTGDRLLAVIVRNDYKQDGVSFFTPDAAAQQIGCIGRAKGDVCEAHVHNMVKRDVFYTSETLIIKEGKVRADIYDNDKTYVQSVIVSKGDVILFCDGGHGFKFLEDTQIVEIKQGPYLSVADKVRFEGIKESEAVLNEKK